MANNRLYERPLYDEYNVLRSALAKVRKARERIRYLMVVLPDDIEKELAETHISLMSMEYKLAALGRQIISIKEP